MALADLCSAPLGYSGPCFHPALMEIHQALASLSGCAPATTRMFPVPVTYVPTRIAVHSGVTAANLQRMCSFTIHMIPGEFFSEHKKPIDNQQRGAPDVVVREAGSGFRA